MNHDSADHDDDAAARTPARAPGRPMPWSTVMSTWAPVAAGVLRSTLGLVMFAASLLTLPMTTATPFLTGVSLVMLVGGVTATLKACRDDDALRRFGRVFPAVVALLAGVAVVVTVVEGPGAFAPQLQREAVPAKNDGAVHFSS
jgi:uncharacterized membrane protein HdeD (DUF308 family)